MLPGVALEVNLKKPLNAGDKDIAELSNRNLKNREGVIAIPKQRFQGCARFAEILTVFKWTHKKLGVQVPQKVQFE